jgi:putative glutamine amidotransferase
LIPLIAIPSDRQLINEQERYTIESAPARAIARIVHAVPLIVPALGASLDPSMLSRVDGLMVPGGLTNVHPSRYGTMPTPELGPFDEDRDATSIPLIRGALRLGIPILMTCRGFQELNVALGGTLKQEPDDLPEEKKHGTPESAKTEDERFALRHPLNIVPGGKLHAILNTKRIQVNSLHSQLIDELAPGLVVEARADDGAIEAVSVKDAAEFALGVVFHPEYWAEQDPPSLKIMRAFGCAVHDYTARKRTTLVPERSDV